MNSDLIGRTSELDAAVAILYGVNGVLDETNISKTTGVGRLIARLFPTNGTADLGDIVVNVVSPFPKVWALRDNDNGNVGQLLDIEFALARSELTMRQYLDELVGIFFDELATGVLSDPSRHLINNSIANAIMIFSAKVRSGKYSERLQ